MPKRITVLVAALLTAIAAATPLATAASSHSGPLIVQRTHPDGATYAIEVPPSWNGTLLTFSLGYGKSAGPDGLPADLGANPQARQWLPSHGHALVGTRPYGDGWAVEESLRDAAKTLAVVEQLAGHPSVTLAWGASMGGEMAAGLAETRPDLIDGALPHYGSIAGLLAMQNRAFDAAFSFATLLSAPLKLADYASADEEADMVAKAHSLLDEAQATAPGRARIALAAAFAQISPWSIPGTAEPGARDWAAQETQDYAALMNTAFSPRYPLEQRAGGQVLLEHRCRLPRAAAGVRKVRPGPGTLRRHRARSRGRSRPARCGTANVGRPASGRLHGQQLHPAREGRGPGADPARHGRQPPDRHAGAGVLRRGCAGGRGRLLRQAFVDGAGHCTYSGAELVTVVLALEQRVKTGTWNGVTAASLNQTAAGLAREDHQLGDSGFMPLRPSRFLRPDPPRRREGSRKGPSRCLAGERSR